MATSYDPANYPKEDFRICPVTSFRVDRKSEILMVSNAVMAVLTLAMGGISSLQMILHKAPGGKLSTLDINSDYYMWVSLHGFNMLIFWVVWFEIAAAYFVATAILNSRLASYKLGWTSFAMMLVGTVMINYIIIADHPNSSIMFTAYFPLKADPLFYLGYILYAVGVLLGGINFLLTVYYAQKKGTYPHKSLPLTVYGVFVAIIIAVQALLNGAIVLIIGLLYSKGWIITSSNIDADWWKQVFWGFGHTAQYINISATAAVWYALIAIAIDAKPLNERYSRMAFLFYLAFTIPVAAHHLIVDPAYSVAFKMVNATIIALGLAIPSLIHAFVIPGAMEAKMRQLNPEANKGNLFAWIRQLPWNEPAIPAVFWSVLLFGVGGILGSIQGTYQLNMITHNTLRINGHFHLTVVAGTTVAFMGLAYYFIELIPRRQIYFGKLKAIQIHLYAIGLAILSLGMFWAGVLGAPRRTATYDTYALGIKVPAWDPGLWVMVVGGFVAILGGALFVFLIVISLFLGKRLPREGDESQAIPDQPEDEDHSATNGFEAPGVMTFGVIFMIIFAVFYLTTFIILGLGWKIS